MKQHLPLATTDLEQIQLNDLHGKISISVSKHEPNIPFCNGFRVLNPGNKFREAEFYDQVNTYWRLWGFPEKDQGPQSGLSGSVAYLCQVNPGCYRTLCDPNLRVFRHIKSELCTAVSKFDLCHLYLSPLPSYFWSSLFLKFSGKTISFQIHSSYIFNVFYFFIF